MSPGDSTPPAKIDLLAAARPLGRRRNGDDRAAFDDEGAIVAHRQSVEQARAEEDL